jgi:hypothetical protein
MLHKKYELYVNQMKQKWFKQNLATFKKIMYLSALMRGKTSGAIASKIRKYRAWTVCLIHISTFEFRKVSMINNYILC